MSMTNEKIALDKYWNELLFSTCKGNAGSINELKRFDIYDFFSYIDNAIKDKEK